MRPDFLVGAFFILLTNKQDHDIIIKHTSDSVWYLSVVFLIGGIMAKTEIIRFASTSTETVTVGGLTLTTHCASRIDENGRKRIYFTHEEALAFEEEMKHFGFRLPTMTEMMQFTVVKASPAGKDILHSEKKGYISARTGKLTDPNVARFWLSDVENSGEAESIVDDGYNQPQLLRTPRNYRLTVRFVYDESLLKR